MKSWIWNAACGLFSGVLASLITQGVLFLEHKAGILKTPTYLWIYYSTTFYFLLFFMLFGFIAFRAKLQETRWGWTFLVMTIVIIFLGIQLIQVPMYIARGGLANLYLGSTARSLAELLVGIIPATYAGVRCVSIESKIVS